MHVPPWHDGAAQASQVGGLVRRPTTNPARVTSVGAMERRAVAIVGGGIAGLALAAHLDGRFFDVEVIEAQPHRHAAGSGLALWPRALRILDRLTHSEALPHSPAPIHQITEPTAPLTPFRSLTGEVRFSVPTPPLRMIVRGDLMDVLHGAVPASVRFSTQQVRHPSTLDAHLVVGADGVRSRVRGLVDPRRAARLATPWLALRGIAHVSQVTHQAQLARGLHESHAPQLASSPTIGIPCGEAWGPGLQWGIHRLTGDRIFWFTATTLDSPDRRVGCAAGTAVWTTDALDVDSEVTRARAQFAAAGAHPALLRALETAGSEAGTSATRLWRAPRLARYVRDRYVVIGDAAHATLPNLGSGANDAIIDAATLAHRLNTDAARLQSEPSHVRRPGTGRPDAQRDSLRRWELGRLPVTQATRWGAHAVMVAGMGPLAAP